MEITSDMIVKYVLIIGILLATFLYVLKLTYIVGGNRGTNKTVLDSQKQRKQEKKELRVRKFLANCSWFCDHVGGDLTEDEKYEWTYRMHRLNIQLKSINHRMTPKEMVGLIRMLQMFTIFIGLTVFFLGNILGLVLIIGSFVFVQIAGSYIDFMLKSTDIDLEKDFPDFYLLLHARLVQGADGRITSSVQDYHTTLHQVYTRPNDHFAIKAFVDDLLVLLNNTKDEVAALTMLREHYRSAMIINFTNLAIQALKGVDNKEKLAAFQMELMEQRRDEMERVGRQRAEMGSYAIYAVYIVLFEIVIMSIMSKGNFGSGMGETFGGLGSLM